MLLLFFLWSKVLLIFKQTMDISFWFHSSQLQQWGRQTKTKRQWRSLTIRQDNDHSYCYNSNDTDRQICAGAFIQCNLLVIVPCPGDTDIISEVSEVRSKGQKVKSRKHSNLWHGPDSRPVKRLHCCTFIRLVVLILKWYLYHYDIMCNSLGSIFVIWYIVTQRLWTRGN